MEAPAGVKTRGHMECPGGHQKPLHQKEQPGSGRPRKAVPTRRPEKAPEDPRDGLCRASVPAFVSAGAKIPIVPVEFSPPLDVINRDRLHVEEVPRLVKGERRARTKRTATARDE